MSRVKRVWMLPLVLLQSYLSFILILYFIGPWPWAQYNTPKLVVYLLAAQACMYVGYVAAWPQVRKIAEQITEDRRNALISHGLKFFQTSFWIYLLMLIPTSLSRSGSIVPDVITGLSYTGAVYNENFDRLADGNAYIVVEYLRIILSPFLVGFYPLLITYWGRIRNWQRIVSLLMVAFNVAIYISIGTNKGIIDAILLLPCFIYFAQAAGSRGLRLPAWVLRAVLIGLVLAFLVFFGRGQEERAGNVGSAGVFNGGLTLVRADAGVVGDILPPSQRIAYESLTRYLTSGYYALSLSFDVPHQTTYGLGNSIFLADQADALFNTNLFTSGSLPGEMERQLGFPRLALWHSIYPWLASDVGFIGALGIIGLLAYVFSWSWGSALVSLDVRHIVMASLMIILFIYVPANNQVLQSGETCFAFIIIGFWLMFARRRGLEVLSSPKFSRA